MPEATLVMEAADFAELARNSMRWCQDDGTYLWEGYERRWEPYPNGRPLDRSFRHIHWLSDCWANVMLARAYLNALGLPYQIVWDTQPPVVPSWAILTDYAC